MANVVTTAETNVIKAENMKKAREIDFVYQFTHNSLSKFLEVLNATRRVPVMEGTTLYVYSITGTLESGNVPEGEIIPLSMFEQEKTPIGDIRLQKWRKASTAESIHKSGFDEAVRNTDASLIRKIERSIRTDFFTFLNGEISGSVTATGVGLQAALADAWGKLQIAFEDDTAETVYFVNPTDVAKYLSTATITMQEAFGMNYIENFLGLGTVILTSQVTAGTFIATAKENIIVYYLAMNGDVANAFEMTADETGFIGIRSGFQNGERAQIESLAIGSIKIMVEYAAGVVKGTITDSAAA